MQDIVIHAARRRPDPADRQSVGPEAAGIFGLLQQGVAESVAQALVTLVEVEGGSSRAIGAQMAVLADGRYCGYLSGGCVEAAIASEAVRCLRNGRDEMLRFGVGSPFLDIRLPCGGSIEVHIHVHPAPDLIAAAVKLLARRVAFGIELSAAAGTARLIESISPTRRTGWHDDLFLCCYAPVTRLLLIGRGVELEQVAQLGVTAGLEVMVFCADDESAATAAANGIVTRRLSTPADPPTLPADPWTAVILLFHEHEWKPRCCGRHSTPTPS